MAWKLAYYEEVRLDIRVSKKWYRDQQQGLEKRFADDVKQCIARLQKHPLHYEVRYRNARIAYCEIFPFGIHFYIDEPAKQLVIIAIVHQHRDPEFSKKR
jgi:plasmid stabilization system protein ParE